MKTFSPALAAELVLLGKILEASPVSAGIMVPMPELEAEMTHNHILSFWWASIGFADFGVMWLDRVCFYLFSVIVQGFFYLFV